MRSEYEAAAMSLEAMAGSIPAVWGPGIVAQGSGNWTYPPLTIVDIQTQVKRAADRIRNLPDDLDSTIVAEIAGIPQRAGYAQSSVIPNFQGNPPVVVGSLLTLMWYVEGLLPSDTLPVWETVKDLDLLPRELAKRVRSLEAAIGRANPKVADVEEQIGTIQAAYAAARSLPTDMALLEEARNEISDLRNQAQSDGRTVDQIAVDATIAVTKIREELEAATKTVAGIDSAYSAATTIGLSKSFNDRAEELKKSVNIWVLCLVVALGLGAVFGYIRLHDFQQLVAQKGAEHWIWMSAGMSLLTVAAPIWFAWLSTRQIGQRFRLAEDYAFKASVAKAYEGYRREAVRLDPQLETRLFSSALDRLDEPPLRFLSHEEHGSPYEALFSNTGFKDSLARAIEKFPSVREAVQAALGKAGSSEKSSTLKPDV